MGIQNEGKPCGSLGELRGTEPPGDALFYGGGLHMPTLSNVGYPRGGNIRDGAVHDVTLAVVYCTPASFAVADGNARLPGPGAVSLPGELRLRLGSPRGALVDMTSDVVE